MGIDTRLSYEFLGREVAHSGEPSAKSAYRGNALGFEIGRPLIVDDCFRELSLDVRNSASGRKRPIDS